MGKMSNIKKFLIVTIVIGFLSFCGAVSGDTVQEGKIDRKRNRLIGYILSKQLPTLHFSDKKLDDELAKAAFDLYIKQLDYQKRFLLAIDVEQLNAFAPSIDNSLVNGRIILPDTGYDILNEKVDIVQKMVDSMLEDDRVVGLNGDSQQGAFKEKISKYKVKPGDTLTAIARKFQNVTVADLLEKNDIDDPSKITVGQELGIPVVSSRPEELKVGIFDVLQPEPFESDPEKIDFTKDLDSLRERWRKILKTQIISEFLDLEQERGKERKKGEKAKAEIIERSDKDLWQKAITKVQKRNRTFFQRLRRETLQDHYDRFFNCVTRAFGPHTNYIPPAGKEQFDINMRGSLEGIGALLREDDGFIKVVRIIPGSASARQGQLKAEDVILEVAQEGEEPVDITEMRLRDAVRLIRGPKGEAVTLTVKKPDGAKETIKIIRDVVQIEETFVKSTVLESKEGKKIGYIFIPSFYRDFEGSRNGGKGRNSTTDTRNEIQKLKEEFVDGIILDLRDDGGGALIDAVDITGLFIESGPVVQVKNSFGDKRILRDKNGAISYDGPMVVLVNKFSASASEIVAGALQDYKRAVIVGGKHTHGKGTVQTIIDLNENIPLLHLRKYKDLGALKIMIQKFYRVNGSSTQYKGVEPDIVLPNLFEHIKSGERYLDYSLPWDAIEPIEYTPWTKSRFDLKKIQARSQKRVGQDEGLQIIKEEAIKAEERSKNTVISIDLIDMREKREESKQIREKVGAHYRKYREEQGEFDNDDYEETKEENLREKWLKEVNEDPYIGEAVNIVGDLIKFPKR